MQSQSQQIIVVSPQKPGTIGSLPRRQNKTHTGTQPCLGAVNSLPKRPLAVLPRWFLAICRKPGKPVGRKLPFLGLRYGPSRTPSIFWTGLPWVTLGRDDGKNLALIWQGFTLTSFPRETLPGAG